MLSYQSVHPNRNSKRKKENKTNQTGWQCAGIDEPVAGPRRADKRTARGQGEGEKV
jgi:hypothetical protein